jgi:hypothetical protein
MIENTSTRDPHLHLLGAVSEGTTGYITGMEAAGQRQVVASTLLPIEIRGASDADFEKLGFTFGAKRDDLFREATLPAGWSKQGSDHNMWSYVVDQHGRRRVAVFYKAAFYDRKADMHLETPLGYLRNALYEGTDPVLDDEWLTAAVADEVLAEERDAELGQAADADEWAVKQPSNAQFWTENAARHRADADKAEALRLRIASRVTT